jgi:hypothetical protein
MSVSEIFDPEQGGCDLCSDQKVFPEMCRCVQLPGIQQAM